MTTPFFLPMSRLRLARGKEAPGRPASESQQSGTQTQLLGVWPSPCPAVPRPVPCHGQRDCKLRRGAPGHTRLRFLKGK